MKKEEIAMLTIGEIRKLYKEGKVSKIFIQELVSSGFITPVAYKKIVK